MLSLLRLRVNNELIYRMIGISQSKHQNISDNLRRHPTQKASDAERLLKGFH